MIVDLHSDLLLDCEARRVAGERDVFRRRHLPALRAAGVRVQVLAIFVETAFLPESALRRALRLVETAEREADESHGALRLVRNRAELTEALAGDAIAGVLALEGAEPLGRDPGLMRVFSSLGVRLVGPTWNRANAFAEGVVEDRGGGFSSLGLRLLAEMEEEAIALDLSHLSPRAVEQAFEGYGGTLLASHANAAAVYANPRNVGDDVVRELARRGSVCGLNFVRAFIGPGRAADRLAAHWAHLRHLGGPELPAVGADFVHFLPEGPPEPVGLGLPPGSDRTLLDLPPLSRDRSYGELADALRDRGVPPAEIDAWRHGNALRVLERCLP